MPMNPRLLRPLATGFNPRSIAGLVGWWDASDASTITLNSGRVSQWANKVASGPDFTQDNAALQPLYVGGGRAGKNVIQMDDTTRRLGNATAIDIGFFAAVLAPTGTQNYGSTLSFANKHGLLRNLTTENLFANAGSLFPAASYRRNGVATSLYGTDWAVFTNGGTKTSNAPRLDVDGIGSFRSTYTIAEVLMYSQQPSQQQQERIQGYLAWKWGLQSQLPYDHPYAKSFPGFGSQTVPTDADTLTYLAAVKAADGTGVEVGVANAVDDFVKGTKADGTWDSIKASCILAGARTLAGALVPLRGTAPTNNNFTASDYNRETGLVGDGSTTYLDSNRAGNADPQDDFHGAVYGTEIPTGSGADIRVLMAQNDATTKAVGLFHYNGLYYTNNRRPLAGNNITSSALASSGFIGTSRSSAAGFEGRFKGSTASFVEASTAPGSGDIAVFAGNANGSIADFADARIAFYSIGESLDIAALDARVSRLIAESQFFFNTGVSGRGYDLETLQYINAGYAAGGSLA